MQVGGKRLGQPRYTYIRGTNNEPKRVYFNEIDGLAIYQGDIILGPAGRMDIIREAVDTRPAELSTRGLIIPDPNRRWPNAIVYYCIADNLPQAQRDAVSQAMDHWQQNTKIRFQVSQCKALVGPVWTHVNFVPGNICASDVGCQGGIQQIHLASGCFRGQVIHEIGHCVGLWHEQSRHDRDSHVTIDLSNVAPENQFNFEKESDSQDFGAYDFGSIMHYGAYDFAINSNKPVITTIPPNQPIGQRDHLSTGDIAAVAAMYP
jgi:astacin